MCGISGFISNRADQSAERLTDLVGQMAESLSYRGPDNQGTWCDPRSGVALGHRRLAILDLSEQGHQPMLSACGQFVLIFNGEIYNFRELRTQLEQVGRKFRGHSDTEVLLTALSEWGLEATLPKLRGMFAFAVWNRTDRTLCLARDRLGIKPLYYGTSNGTLLFASELKAIRQHPDSESQINPSAVALLMRHCYIPAPYSIYESYQKLPAGHYLKISVDITDDLNPVIGSAEPEPYWDFEQVVRSGQANQFKGSYTEAVSELGNRIKDSIRYRMLADVPVGAFLSGGIDSSLVVAMMQELAEISIKTFSIGFTEREYDEAPYAKRIADYLGTDHTELCVMPQEAQAVIPSLPEMYDEPFADMSQVPTYLISKLARRSVTVSLSGDGGDELFGGYHRYAHITGIWKKLQRIPARKTATSVLEWYVRHMPGNFKKQGLKRIGELMRMQTPHQLYAELNRHWSPEEILAKNVIDPSSLLGYGERIANLPGTHLNWMALDTLTYLPDDILTKVDRASMAVSLEARVPLLDHHVVEFAWQLPDYYRFNKVQGKLPLRSLLERYLPAKLYERPKVGFGIPIGEWLRGPLHEWASDLLSPAAFDRHGLLNGKLISERWQDHQSGASNWQYHLWDVLMFQSWYLANHG